jgi:hypothetical protein
MNEKLSRSVKRRLAVQAGKPFPDCDLDEQIGKGIEIIKTLRDKAHMGTTGEGNLIWGFTEEEWRELMVPKSITQKG